MSKLIAFTVELYKADKRIKQDERYGRNKTGLRFVETVDFAPSTRDYISTVEVDMRERGFVVNVFDKLFLVFVFNFGNRPFRSTKYNLPTWMLISLRSEFLFFF